MNLYKTYCDERESLIPNRIYAPLTNIIGTGLKVPVVIFHRNHPLGKHVTCTRWQNVYVNFNVRMGRQ